MKNRSHHRVERKDLPITLQDFLAARLGLSRNRAKALLDRREVFVNQRRVWMARHRLSAGDEVEIQESRPEPRDQALPVLLEADGLLVIDKPAALLSNGPDSAESRLRTQTRNPAWRAVHRLDRDTTGCLIFARNDDVWQHTVEQFRGKQVQKTYQALVAGKVKRGTGTLRQPVDGREAVTTYRVLATGAGASWLRLTIETGRTHQIRRHLAGIGHPLLGDRQYATEAITDAALRRVPRQLLHASQLALPRRDGHEILEARAPLPGDFQHWKKRLGLVR